MKKILLSVLVVCLLILTGCLEQNEISQKENQQKVIAQTQTSAIDVNVASNNINAKIGDIFTITLPSNQTTGYRWQISEFTSGIVQLEKDEYKRAENTRGLVGAGGEQIWTFKAVGAGTVTIHFEYARSWEKNIPAIKKVDYTITITK
jgi:inhibitor of cysteine peptidase